MNIKSDKGFTGVDITIAVLIITVFTAIIAALYQNYIITSKNIERKSEAINYAIQEIESLKTKSDTYFSEDNADRLEITEYENVAIGTTGFSKTAIVQDYAKFSTKEDVQLGYVKKIIVKISYKLGNKEQSVELNTIISKEN